ncbi:putative propionyl-CoA carboxylase beta chain [Bacillus subtilis]|nr:methylmalonyl-CoA carboxyltransferase [Bacillus halotolerans]OEC78166.1 methylmalonyl-CoA carboxyltransferase [Bacillus halotolerans]BDG80585.1 putative propionyl-CoA carboxylase beta chain [Bacillus subtilis]
MNMNEHIGHLYNRRRQAEEGGGHAKQAEQRKKGKLTARERIAYLLDEDSFIELYPFMESRSLTREQRILGDGVVTGYGTIDGRSVYVFAQDFTVFGGALGETHAKKITSLMDLAAKNKAPIIGLNDSGGARIQEGVVSLDGYGHIFYRNVLYSGVIPQISVILGPCAGGAVYSPALTDFIFMAEQTGRMFITGPKVIEKVTGEQVDAESLGGAGIHNAVSGNAHFSGKTEEEVLAGVKKLLSYLPLDKQISLPSSGDEASSSLINRLVPADSTKPYDVRAVIQELADPQSFFEIQPYFAKNIVIGFAKLGQKTIGIVANQPKHLAGSLTIDAADKAARFIRFCDAFDIPLLTVEDVPGFLPGIQQEHNGIIRHGAKLLFAYAEATVPKVTLIIRKAYGGSYVAMNSKSIGADLVFAWPNAEIAVMGAEGAVSILYHKDIEASADPQKTKCEKTAEYKKQNASPYKAAACGMVDDIILPEESRKRLIQAFHMLAHKTEERPKKKHGNIPL